ncbi:MAG: DUF1844 domain-containing protein [Candidatus Eisenbacteria bacterium]|nr:DUF1844 domain-containing protein [Candidatus Eisenbacteria bacterium]
MADTEEKKGIDGYLFRLIATFEAAGMQQMGKIASPLTGDVEVSLEGARDAIEMLDMVKRKTLGNLNEDESRYLEHVLYQLRMNYVEVAKGAGEETPNEGGDTERGGGDTERGGGDTEQGGGDTEQEGGDTEQEGGDTEQGEGGARKEEDG